VASPVCVVCKKPIPKGALKCTECSSFQGWRRHLEFSSLALSLLVALVSVSGIVVPALIKAIRPPSSDVRASLVSVERVEVRPQPSYAVGKLRYVLPVLILVTNPGERPALLKECNVRVQGAGQSAEARVAQVESFPAAKGTLTVLPVKLTAGEFRPLRLLVDLSPSADLPEDWSLSEVRSSNEIKREVTIGGVVDLAILNDRAGEEAVSVEMPDRPVGFMVPLDKLFETWRRTSNALQVQGSSAKNRT
jgi:hypothetical protein